MAETDTSERLLDAAVALFAERGFAGASVRDLTKAAGVNQAAIHYHFGSKEAVLRAATDRIVEPLNRRRNQLLDALLERTDGHPSSDELLRIFVQADLEILRALDDQGASARLLGRIYSDPDPGMQTMARDQFGPTGARFIAELDTALPHLTTDEVAWRVEQIVAVIVRLFARWPDRGMSTEESQQLLDRHVAFLGPGLRAPPAPSSSPG